MSVDDEADTRRVRLSWLLQPYAARDCPTQEVLQDYGTSAEAHRFYYRMDVAGLLMAVINNVVLGILISQKHSSSTSHQHNTWVSSLTACKICMVLAVLQLIAVTLHRSNLSSSSSSRQQQQQHLKSNVRHGLAIFNRCYRLVLSCLQAVQTDFNIVGDLRVWAANHSAKVTLAMAVCLCPVLQLQTSINFVLPLRLAVLIQPLAVAVVTSTVLKLPQALASIPGVPAAAEAVCSSLQTFRDVAMFVMFEFSGVPFLAVTGHQGQGGALQVPQPHEVAAAVATITTAGPCGLQTVFLQLLLFMILMLNVFVPLYATYLLELGQKVAFYERQGFSVEADASPFLPLPGCPWVSRLLVVTVAPLLLWVAVEALVTSSWALPFVPVSLLSASASGTTSA